MPSVEIVVRVTPKARREEILPMRDGVLPVKVIAPPVDGKANKALCRLLAKRLGIAVSAVTVVRGSSARTKTVRVFGVSAEQLHAAFGPVHGTLPIPSLERPRRDR